ncbi:RNA polymerase-binding protein RbpA [Crossiella sp. SN42]|uniref:RNA polymerase-binding protein RbpA n=1 Tax=Crossiella sp. SN42 TaxID=2944808 RepID=UPI00207D5698|nr:RNA polymerase-binding protein RbpA [Crossiella sp. SN42]MCO1575508.1 RNA polymerase-binding protein RbpA [Crossiella sp. SN42]
MSDLRLRGWRLSGHVSYEQEYDAGAATKSIAYDCPKGCTFTIPFAEDAEVPPTWECRHHGAESACAVRENEPEPKKVKPPRTHWDMLLERRSIDELEELLNEKLAERAAERRPPRRNR